MVTKRHAIHAIFLLILLAVFTAPCSAANDDSFAVIGDTRVGATDGPYTAFIRQVQKDGIQTVIHVGDAIDSPGTEEQWAKLLSITGTKVNLCIAPGNHDVNSRRALATYTRMLGKEPYYSISRNDTLLILLNSELPGQEVRITGQQLEWLEKELARGFKYKFVFLHRPVFPSPIGTGYGLDRHPADRNRLHQLFAKGGVALVMAGHEHLYNRSEKDGIVYVITGGGGAPLHGFTEDQGAFLHYIVAKKRNEGYFFRVVDFKGNTREEFSVQK
jgi:serine/threonine-protein phosphatase CPPED1